MRLFAPNERREAIEHALAGGQAVLVLEWADPLIRRTPAVVQLLDQDEDRLVRTMREKGMWDSYRRVMAPGAAEQHIEVRNTRRHPKALDRLLLSVDLARSWGVAS